MGSTQPQAIVPQRSSPLNTLRQLLDRSKEQIALALPRHLSPERMIRVALTAIQRTPKLQDCDPISVIGAVVTASQLGLEPDGILGQAYLVPFWNSKTRRYEAQLQPGYRGLIALARRSGEVSSLYSELVYAADKFKVVKGDSPKLLHEPNYDAENRGELRGAYAVVIYRDGGKDFEYMPMHELNKIRAASKSKDKEGNEYGPWVTHPEEMYRKVPIRRLAKRLPLSPEFQRAAIMDEYVDAGVAPDLAAEIHDAEVVRQATEQRAQALADKYRPELQAAPESPDGEPAQDDPEVASLEAQDPPPAPEQEAAPPVPEPTEAAEASPRSRRRSAHDGREPQGVPLDFSKR